MKTPWYLTLLRVVTWILYVWVVIGIVSLILRIFLLLFGANPSADFVQFVLRVSASYLQPFRDIFPPRDLNDTFYLDVSAMFAVIVYGLLAGLVSAAVEAIARRIHRSEIRQRQELAQYLLSQQAGAAPAAPPAAVAVPVVAVGAVGAQPGVAGQGYEVSVSVPPQPQPPAR